MGLWDFLIVQPIAFLLRNLYEITGNYGVSIIMFAVAAKVVLLWFAYKGKRGMLQQQRIQPKLQELQKKCGGDKQKMQQEQAKLYQDEGISMFGGCLWMFIPFPIIIALYTAVRQPLRYILNYSAEKISELVAALPEGAAKGGFEQLHIAETEGLINFEFLGLNLSETPSFASMLFLIPILSALTSLLSVWLTQKFSGRPPAQGNSQIMMFLLGPGMSLWIGFSFPAALGVYWIMQNVLGIPQEYFLSRYWNRKLDEEDAAKAAKEERRKAAEAVQKEEDRKRRAERIAASNQKHKPKRYKLQNTIPPNKPSPKKKGEDGH